MVITKAVLCVLVMSLLAPVALAQLTEDDIERLQQQGIDEGWTFEVGLNEATQYPLKQLTGLREPDKWRATARFDMMTLKRDLPSSFNWKDSGGCTPIKNQSMCGSCWAFSTVGPLECNILIQDGREVDLSEQYLVSCNSDGWDCDGGWLAHDYHQWKEGTCGDSGAVFEDVFPYTSSDAVCGCPCPREYYLADWAFIGPQWGIPTVEQLKQAILEYGPISVCVHSNDAMQAYNSGIFNGCESGGINHAVVLVGWDDNQGDEGIWYMRNSWGAHWGEFGYMRMAYGCSEIGYGAAYVDYQGGSYWTSDTAGGWIPIDVAFEAISGHDAAEWIWDFGDGGSSAEQSPSHTFDTPGYFDVTLSVVANGDTSANCHRGCVSAVADTMTCGQVSFGDGSNIEVTVYAVNKIPLKDLLIPIEFDGSLGLDPYDITWTTAGCRTEHLDYQGQVHFNPAARQASYRLANLNGSGNVPPGEGPVLKLYFNVQGVPAYGQEAELNISGYSDHQQPRFMGDYITYRPATNDGIVSYQNCCVGIRGNVDGDPADKIDISDLIYLVVYMFQEGPESPCMKEANVNGDIWEEIDIGDIIHLVNYMFQDGAAPVICY